MAVAVTDKLFVLSGDADDDKPAELTIRIGSSGATIERTDRNNILMTVQELTRAINQLGQYVEKISHNHATILASFQNQAAKDENDQLLGDIRKLSYKIHNELKRMKQEIEPGLKEGHCPNAELKAQYIALSWKFCDVMGGYRQELEDYRHKSRDCIKRQLKLSGKLLMEEQIEEMLDSDDPQLFTQDNLDSEQKQQALGEVVARHQELLRLEESVKELHDVFHDVSLLVKEQEFQGELMGQVGGRVKILMQATSPKDVIKKEWVICCVVCGAGMIVLLIMAIAGGLAAYFVLNS